MMRQEACQKQGGKWQIVKTEGGVLELLFQTDSLGYLLGSQHLLQGVMRRPPETYAVIFTPIASSINLRTVS